MTDLEREITVSRQFADAVDAGFRGSVRASAVAIRARARMEEDASSVRLPSEKVTPRRAIPRPR